jgi:hypothetical protein
VSFLSLPLELRLEIYDYALLESNELTIATILDRSDDPTPSFVPGVPENHIPIIHNGFDEDLLSFTHLAPQEWSTPDSALVTPASSLPPTPMSTPPLTRQNSYFGSDASLPIKPAPFGSSNPYAAGGTDSSTAYSPESSPYSLLATCAQIRAELSSYLSRRTADPLTLHISFPYGLLVLQHMYPALLTAAKTVNICGFYTGEHSRWSQRERLPHYQSKPDPRWPNPPNISPLAHNLAWRALTDAIAALFGPPEDPRSRNPGFESLSVRVFYPSPQRYGVSICDAESPWCVVMSNIEEGVIDSRCWRGAGGTAWAMQARPVSRGLQGPRKFVTTSWPTFFYGKGEDWMGVVTGGRYDTLLFQGLGL